MRGKLSERIDRYLSFIAQVLAFATIYYWINVPPIVIPRLAILANLVIWIVAGYFIVKDLLKDVLGSEPADFFTKAPLVLLYSSIVYALLAPLMEISLLIAVNYDVKGLPPELQPRASLFALIIVIVTAVYAMSMFFIDLVLVRVANIEGMRKLMQWVRSRTSSKIRCNEREQHRMYKLVTSVEKAFSIALCVLLIFFIFALFNLWIVLYGTRIYITVNNTK